MNFRLSACFLLFLGLGPARAGNTQAPMRNRSTPAQLRFINAINFSLDAIDSSYRKALTVPTIELELGKLAPPPGSPKSAAAPLLFLAEVFAGPREKSAAIISRLDAREPTSDYKKWTQATQTLQTLAADYIRREVDSKSRREIWISFGKRLREQFGLSPWDATSSDVSPEVSEILDWALATSVKNPKGKKTPDQLAAARAKRFQQVVASAESSRQAAAAINIRNFDMKGGGAIKRLKGTDILEIKIDRSGQGGIRILVTETPDKPEVPLLTLKFYWLQDKKLPLPAERPMTRSELEGLAALINDYLAKDYPLTNNSRALYGETLEKIALALKTAL